MRVRPVRCSRCSTPTARADLPTSKRSGASRATARTSSPPSRRSPPGDGSSRSSESVLVLLLARRDADLTRRSGSSSATRALPYDAIAIVAIVLLNSTLGFVQEARAEQAVAALRSMSAAEATVVRDGERRRVHARELVAGDLLLLEEGDTVPADARVIESTALQAAEASLTGESLPVDKSVDALPADTALGDRLDMLFSGTTVTYGRGRAVVVATGMRTEMGRVAGHARVDRRTRRRHCSASSITSARCSA